MYNMNPNSMPSSDYKPVYGHETGIIRYGEKIYKMDFDDLFTPVLICSHPLFLVS
jgi:hypothetical protein